MWWRSITKSCVETPNAWPHSWPPYRRVQPSLPALSNERIWRFANIIVDERARPMRSAATMARKTAVVVVGVHMWCCPMTAWGRHCRWSSPPAVWDRRDAGSRARRPWQRDGPTMCGRPTSCCRIAFRQRLLINLTNWHTGSLCLNRSIKVTEGQNRREASTHPESLPYNCS